MPHGSSTPSWVPDRWSCRGSCGGPSARPRASLPRPEARGLRRLLPCLHRRHCMVTREIRLQRGFARLSGARTCRLPSPLPVPRHGTSGRRALAKCTCLAVAEYVRSSVVGGCALVAGGFVLPEVVGCTQDPGLGACPGAPCHERVGTGGNGARRGRAAEKGLGSHSPRPLNAALQRDSRICHVFIIPQHPNSSCGLRVLTSTRQRIPSGAGTLPPVGASTLASRQGPVSGS